ncbi:septal ring lytic transglycosylase RlpA family protein [Halomonas salina]|uniref:Endolytic peptidoglycan transglycosylase RlpA n=1 Tax=Halomonas salina TaxID=42565 RepID=A0ABR4WT88_9GAMM|nr:septal ring lytic transglycosylase RlpA family protein [Halomonas salina]KGE77937.1 lipoprotein A [Halomonas salina]
MGISGKAGLARPRGFRRLVQVGLVAWMLGAAGASLAHEDQQGTSIQKGVASYYSDYFQGRTTASGDAFDQRELTAAHRTLPFGTKVLVTRPDNGRQVEVMINDRGPFVSGRVIDLSKSAARALGMLHRGTARVQLSLAD